MQSKRENFDNTDDSDKDTILNKNFQELAIKDNSLN